VMMVACVVGAIALRFTKETAGKSLRGTELPGDRRPSADQSSGNASQPGPR
jgi:MHS family proline/betaine transporter-like MFS transporter